MKKTFWVFIIVLIFGIRHTAGAQGAVPPQLIALQGYVVDSTGTPVNHSLPMKFRLYTDSLAILWVFEQSFDTVKIATGVYNVYLNVSGVNFNTAYWLETEINTHVLSPRTRLVSVPYALLSQTAQAAQSAEYADSSRATGNAHAAQYADSSRAAGTVRYADSARVAGTSGGQGFSLPFSDSVNNSGSTFKLNNSGSGATAEFVQSNPAAMTQALKVTSTGSAALALRVENTGNFSAALFTNSSNYSTVSSLNNGSGDGLYASSSNGSGVRGISNGSGNGLEGSSTSGYGVHGASSQNYGVFGHTDEVSNSQYAGVHGEQGDDGTYGELGTVYNAGGFLGHIHTGVYGYASNNTYIDYAVYGYGSGTYAWAGYFDGRVKVNGDETVTGTLSKGGGSFKIDHPLDPANKYLYHSFVESPDMMNIYNGNVALDDNGEATIILPNWFEALNKDFRYQLTAIGAPGPNLYIAQEESGNHFRIAGGMKGMKVSWQITGVRKDAWAEQHRIPVEENKVGLEKGKYLHPVEHGMPESMGISLPSGSPLKPERQK